MNIGKYVRTGIKSVTPVTPMKEVARLFFETGESVIPVVEKDGSYAGIISIDDFLLVFLPEYIDMIGSVDFIHDFGALEPTSFSVEEMLFVAEDLMMDNAAALDIEDSIMKAAVSLHKLGLQQMPVLSAGRLVGMISQNDICRAFYEMEGHE